MKCISRLLGILALAAAVLPTSAAAARTLTVQIGSLGGPGWEAQGVTLDIRLNRNSPQASIQATEVRFPALPAEVHRLTQLQGRCPHVEVTGSVMSCANAVITADFPLLGRQRLHGTFRYDTARKGLRFALNGARLGHGTAQAKGEWTESAWKLVLLAHGLPLGSIASLLRKVLALPAQSTLSGTAFARIELSGDSNGMERVAAQMDLEGMTLETPNGSLATDRLRAHGRLLLDKIQAGWRLVFNGGASGGQAYADPVFMNLAENPIQFSANGVWRTRDGQLTLTGVTLHQKGAFLAHATSKIRTDEGLARTDLKFRLDHASLAAAYRLYLQPFLIGTTLDSLQIGGNATGEFDLRDGRPSRMALRLATTKIKDTKGRFDFTGLTANINWTAIGSPGKPPTPSTVAWRRASAYRIPLGPATVESLIQGRDFRLTGPVRIPVLNGALDIGTLSVARMGQPDMAIAFNARLSKIGLPALCAALGWPPFSGTLSGRLPTLTYRRGILSLGGDLQARVFDGHIAVEDLRARQPFGTVPELSATIKIRNLNLKPLTDAFSFGTIEGRLDGEINNLRLINWQPAAFDARFYTPAGDQSRHLISQRAIENISSLGGGPTGALSRGFLQFFKTFSYDRIGLSCRLKENVCLMNGLQPAGNGGYYIVKGAGLPRVDVVGFAHEVSWNRLVEQLKAAIQSGAPKVK